MENDIRHWMRLVEAIRGYHGSSTGLTDPTFVIGHTGYNSNTFGHYQSTRWGAFFSDNPDFSRMYGEPVAYDLNIHHTVELENDNTVWNFVQSLDAFDPEERNLFLDAQGIMRSNEYWALFEDEIGERFVSYLRELGFDSALFVEYLSDDHGVEHRSHTIVVIDPGLIKRVRK